MSIARPKIPKKLPPESRRPLSIIQDFSAQKNVTQDETFSNEYVEDYITPIQQPSTNKTLEDKFQNDLNFFNENAYETNEPSSSDDYSENNDKSTDTNPELVYQFLSESMTLPKNEQQKDLEKQLENVCLKETETANCSTPIKEEKNDAQEKPPIPPKRSKTSSSISLKCISNDSFIEDDSKDYICPTETSGYSLGKINVYGI